MKSYTITVNGNVYDVTVEEGTGSTKEGSVKVTAPMPGKVLSISANPGQAVKKGETILVFEAMKMENSVVAPEDATVASISVSVGDSFEAGAVIATLN